jgi:adenylyltransferase/sulfurtransferase
LLRSHVAVVGVGAVGGRTAELLCRAGVGRLTIIDKDIVQFSNLHRQTLYTWPDAESGLKKAEAFRRHLNEIMPTCQVFPKCAELTSSSVDELLAGVDIVADGTDNFETRFAINDWCIAKGVPWIYAGAVGTKASTFPVLGPGRCLRCLFPEPPSKESLPTADNIGVLGAATAMAAAQSSALVLRVLLNDRPDPVFMTRDVWSGAQSSMTVEQIRSSHGNIPCPICSKSK